MQKQHELVAAAVCGSRKPLHRPRRVCGDDARLSMGALRYGRGRRSERERERESESERSVASPCVCVCGLLSCTTLAVAIAPAVADAPANVYGECETCESASLAAPEKRPLPPLSLSGARLLPRLSLFAPLSAAAASPLACPSTEAAALPLLLGMRSAPLFSSAALSSFLGPPVCVCVLSSSPPAVSISGRSPLQH